MQPPSDVAVPRWGNVVTDVEPDAFDESQPVPATTVTLVEGASFTICGADGGIDGGGVTGLFVGDTRICSRMLLSIDGGSVEPLTLASRSPSWAFICSTARISTIHHNFHEHPLFQVAELIKLGKELAPFEQCRFMRPGLTPASVIDRFRQPTLNVEG